MGGGKNPRTNFRTSAPLPFAGQKRGFARRFAEIASGYPTGTVFVDLFGGSGLFSHIARRACPAAAAVIYNDYDGFRDRLAAIPQTNRLLASIREAVAGTPRNKMVREPARSAVLDIIAAHEREHGYVDYITLSASILFSGKWRTSFDALAREGLYNCVRASDIPPAADYLDGIEVVSADYREIYERYRDTPGVVFVVDPPYLSTDVSSYRMTWSLSDYLDVLSVLPGHDFVFFTSSKSQLVELCDWLGRNNGLGNPLARCALDESSAVVNHNAGYTDMMFHTCRG